jgi:hypothetical protein
LKENSDQLAEGNPIGRARHQQMAASFSAALLPMKPPTKNQTIDATTPRRRHPLRRTLIEARQDHDWSFHRGADRSGAAE